MHYDAVIFDFFGTLNLPWVESAHVAAVSRVASAMHVPVETLVSVLAWSFDDRSQGRWGSFEETMERLAHEAGASLTSDQLAAVCEARLQSQREMVNLRPETLPTVEALSRIGVSMGLITDCTHELVTIWPQLPIAPYFDSLVFSIEQGTKKPDPVLYQLAADELGVEPEACLYVGDGGSNELNGADNVGMTAVLLYDEPDEETIVYGRQAWDELTIRSLSEVPGLLDRLST